MTSPRETQRPPSPEPEPGATSDTAASLEPVAPTATTAAGLEPVADTAQTAAALAPVVGTDQTAAALPPVGNDRTAAVLPPVAGNNRTAAVLPPVWASPDPRALYLKWGPLGALLAIAVLGLGLYLLDSGSGAREGMADLVLSSTPAGATVVIDGRSLPGRTPVTVRDLPTDRPHLAIVELPGYQRWSRHLKLTPGTPSTLHALLQPAQP